MAPSPQHKIAASCLILAGGQGKRLTPDKPLLEIEGKPIIQRTAEVVASLFEEVIVVTNSPEKYRFLSLPVAADERPGCGPLMGIYSGLRQARGQAAFVCAADMPFLSAELIRAQFQELPGHDIVVPAPEGRPEFLHAFYRRSCLPVIRESLDADRFKIGELTGHCRTRRLSRGWFAARGLAEDMELAFTNINTVADYRRWLGGSRAGSGGRPERGGEGLAGLAPEVRGQIKEALIAGETAYHQRSGGGRLSSLWAHSSRVGRIAHRLARAEGLEPEPALLAGLLHDTGKFVHGAYHEDEVPEERHAVGFVQRLLAGTAYERWIPLVSQAILTMYLDERDTTDLGRVAYDADSLDKLGSMGVAQFFAKNALRRRFLDEDLLMRTSIELTYAHHAPANLKTATGRAWAGERAVRTREFFTRLLEEWEQLGLGAWEVLEEEIGGIVCLLVVPRQCSCGGALEPASDILDALKCRSVVVQYRCRDCGQQSEYSFCLPEVRGLPPKP